MAFDFTASPFMSPPGGSFSPPQVTGSAHPLLTSTRFAAPNPLTAQTLATPLAPGQVRGIYTPPSHAFSPITTIYDSSGGGGGVGASFFANPGAAFYTPQISRSGEIRLQRLATLNALPLFPIAEPSLTESELRAQRLATLNALPLFPIASDSTRSSVSSLNTTSTGASSLSTRSTGASTLSRSVSNPELRRFSASAPQLSTPFPPIVRTPPHIQSLSTLSLDTPLISPPNFRGSTPIINPPSSFMNTRFTFSSDSLNAPSANLDLLTPAASLTNLAILSAGSPPNLTRTIGTLQRSQSVPNLTTSSGIGSPPVQRSLFATNPPLVPPHLNTGVGLAPPPTPQRFQSTRRPPPPPPPRAPRSNFARAGPLELLGGLGFGLTGLSAILSQLPRQQQNQAPTTGQNVSLLGSIAPQTSPRSLDFLSGVLRQAILTNQGVQQINRNLVGAFTLQPVF